MAEEEKKPEKSSFKASDAFGSALAGLLPSVVGALFEGTEGAAAGAKFGTEFLQGQAAQQNQANLQAQGQQNKLQLQNLAQVGRNLNREDQQSFQSLEAEKQRDFQSEQAAGLMAGKSKSLKDKILGEQKVLNQKNTTALRKEFDSNDVTKQTGAVVQSYNRIEEVVKNPSAAGDLATIFNFMKMLDPNSVVRESEFKSAEQAKAWLSKVDAGEFGNVNVPSPMRTAIQKADPNEKGAFLLPEQRQDFFNRAKGLRDAQLKSQETLVNSQLRRVAGSLGVDDSLVISPGFTPRQENPNVEEKVVAKKPVVDTKTSARITSDQMKRKQFLLDKKNKK